MWLRSPTWALCEGIECNFPIRTQPNLSSHNGSRVLIVLLNSLIQVLQKILPACEGAAATFNK